MIHLLPAYQSHKHVFSDAWFKVPGGSNLIILQPFFISTLDEPEETGPAWTGSCLDCDSPIC